MPSDAVIGGTGLESYPGLVVTGERRTTTAFGEPSAPLVMGDIAGRSVAFLSRHGPDHGIAPHRINYRANVRALRDAGVERIYAVAAVGGIAPGLEPGEVVVPDQVIDYTVSRTNTFFDEGRVVHVDMTHPYTPSLRNRLLRAATAAGVAVHDGGVYGVTEGPRFETAAEIDRMERDGCAVVGMTAMPEAASPASSAWNTPPAPSCPMRRPGVGRRRSRWRTSTRTSSGACGRSGGSSPPPSRQVPTDPGSFRIGRRPQQEIERTCELATLRLRQRGMWCTPGRAGILPAWSMACHRPPRAGSPRSREVRAPRAGLADHVAQRQR